MAVSIESNLIVIIGSDRRICAFLGSGYMRSSESYAYQIQIILESGKGIVA